MHHAFYNSNTNELCVLHRRKEIAVQPQSIIIHDGRWSTGSWFRILKHQARQCIVPYSAFYSFFLWTIDNRLIAPLCRNEKNGFLSSFGAIWRIVIWPWSPSPTQRIRYFFLVVICLDIDAFTPSSTEWLSHRTIPSCFPSHRRTRSRKGEHLKCINTMIRFWSFASCRYREIEIFLRLKRTGIQILSQRVFKWIYLHENNVPE